MISSAFIGSGCAEAGREPSLADKLRSLEKSDSESKAEGMNTTGEHENQSDLTAGPLVV